MKPTFSLTTQNTSGGVLVSVVNTIKNLSETYQQSDTIIGSTTLLVENTQGFIAGNPILLGSVGSENAEFNISPTITDSENLVTDATLQNHNRGQILSHVLYNQIVIESSPDNLTWTPLLTSLMDPTRSKTQYLDASGTPTTYYRVAFRNSVSTGTSNYAGPQQSEVSATEVTAGGIINSVIKSEGIAEDDPQITTEFLLCALDDANGYVDELSYGYARPWRQQFEYPIQMLAGSNYVELPDDMSFNDSNRHLLSVRIPTRNIAYNDPLFYIDKKQWNDFSFQYSYTYVDTVALIGATSLILENTGNLPASGTIQIACELPTDTIMAVSYTGNDVATSTLTGVTGITRNLSSGVQVWASFEYSYPFHYTIFEKRLWFSTPVPQELNGALAYIDFYKKRSKITSIDDVIEDGLSKMYTSYLKYAIKHRRDANVGVEDGDYIIFDKIVTNITESNYNGQSLTIINNS